MRNISYDQMHATMCCYGIEMNGKEEKLVAMEQCEQYKREQRKKIAPSSTMFLSARYTFE